MNNRLKFQPHRLFVFANGLVRIDNPFFPYIRGEHRYIYEALLGVPTSDFLMLSWPEKNFIFSYVFGVQTFLSDLNLDLYQCQPQTLSPRRIPEYINKQIAFQELSKGVLIGFYNSFEFCNSVIRIAQSRPIFVKIFNKKNTVDIGIATEEKSLLGSIDYSSSKFDMKADISAPSAFSEIKIMKRPPTLFISYSNKDKAFAKQLSTDLNNSGIKVWVDLWEIKVGDSIIEKISKAIQENDYIGVVLSSNSCYSNWVTKELALGLTKELEEKRVVVLPFLAKRCEIPPMLRDKRYVNFIHNYRSALEEVISRLMSDKIKQ